MSEGLKYFSKEDKQKPKSMQKMLEITNHQGNIHQNYNKTSPHTS